MKIVIVNPSLGLGGAEKVISLLSNQWIEESHVVTVITVDRGENPKFILNDKVKRVPLLKGVSQSSILALPRKVFALLKLRRLIKNEKPNLIFAFQEENAIHLLLSLIGVTLPKIVAVRNHPAYKKLSIFYMLLRKLLYRHSDFIIVQTEEIKSWFIKKGYKSLIVIPNPINPNNYQLVKKDEKKIYACGRLVPQKGFDGLIRIFTKVTKKYPEWDLIIIGEGNELDNLKKLVVNYNVQKKVIFKGYDSTPYKNYFLGGIFAFTSQYEGFPNALCEAMASGMSVVSYNCPSGPSDLIENGVNGFLIDLNNEELFRIKLEELIHNEQLRVSIGKNAQNITSYLSVDKIANRWLELNT